MAPVFPAGQIQRPVSGSQGAPPQLQLCLQSTPNLPGWQAVRGNPNSWLIQQSIWKITAFTLYSNFKQSCAGTEWSTSASLSYSNNNCTFLSAASASEHKVHSKLSHLVCTSQGNLQWVPTGMAFFSMETRRARTLAGSRLVVTQNAGGTVAPQFATSPIKAWCACWKMQVKAQRVWGNGRDTET